MPLASHVAVAGEQRFVVHGVSWAAYVGIRDALDTPGVRMTYLRGALELMSPSSTHEDHKTTIARLIEVHALERGLALYGYGSTTFRSQAQERGDEPDECWTIGHKLQDRPDIVLEVVLTSGGIDKLEVYRGLAVREVWFWEGGRFHLHLLEGDAYRPVERSTIIADLDFSALARFVQMDDQAAAVAAYRDFLRAG
jgi:Uma2 family endonuclease